MEQFIRTEKLIGEQAIEKLKNARVAVFGVGGVGSYVVEALARAGVGQIALFDNDEVNLSNINRQLIALHSTIGRKKVDVAKERILDINPDARVESYPVFYLPENADEFPLDKYDYVVDAIDTATAKIELAVRAKKSGVPIISSMGTGNKLLNTEFEITDIYKTSVCPLARVMRKELKKRGIKSLTVLYSKEQPRKTEGAPASISYVPSAAGLVIAGHIIREFINY